MKGNKLMIAIVAVVLVAVVAMAAVMLTGGEEKKEITPAGDETYCWVYGNANMDDVVDEKDIEYLQAIIDGKLDETAYADANQDSVIDDKDIAVVQGFIDKTGDKRYYTMDDGNVGSVKGKIEKLGAQYYANMYAISAMGAALAVTCGDDETADIANTGGFGPAVQKIGWKNYGYGDVEVETVLAMPCDAIVCGTDYFDGWEEKYFTESTYMNLIRLGCWEVDPACAVMTIAVLLQNDDYIAHAKQYVEFNEKTMEMADDAVAKLGKKKSVVIIYPYKDGSMEFQGPTTGCYESSLAAGLDNLATGLCDPKKDHDGGFHVLDLEEALTYDPDSIVILKGCGWERTQEDVNAAYDTYVAKYLSNMRAVKENNVWFSSWTFTQGVTQPLGSLMMLSEIYGVEGIDTMVELQNFVDTFTSLNIGLNPGDADYHDVTKEGMYFNKATNAPVA